MRIHRILTPLFAAVASVTGLAVASPAQAENAIVKLVSQYSGKCLQPVNGSTAQGEPIVQITCNGTRAQQWIVEPQSSGKGVHLRNRASQLCMDAAGGAANGTPIIQWPCNWISNENWSFGITNNLLVSLVSKTSSHCIATPGTPDGLPMELRSCDGNLSQRWNRPPG